MSVKDNFSVAATLSQLRYLVFQGMKGDTGDSAYEEAVKLGFVGTEEEWIASLKGEPGANGRDGQDGAPGAPGTPGRDGVSPTVQTEPISGGHRVTITDAEHPSGQTFDVMDGEDGPGAVDSVNGKTGVVVLDASDVGALPDSTVIPPTVTEQTVSGWGFTKNAVRYDEQMALTDTQKATARTNIGAVGELEYDALESDIESLEADLSLKLDAADAPTKVSDLTNDTGYITASQVPAAPVQSVNGRTGSVTVNEVPAVGGTDNKKVLTADNGTYSWEAVQSGETTKRISLYKNSQTGVYTCSMSATQLHEALPNVVLATEDYRVPVSAYSIDKDDSYVKAVFIDDRPENNAAIVWTLSAASASDLVAVTREECSIEGLPDYSHAIDGRVLTKTKYGPRWAENIPKRAASLRLLYDGAFGPDDPDLMLMANIDDLDTGYKIVGAIVSGTIGSAALVDVASSNDVKVYDLYAYDYANDIVVFARTEGALIRTATLSGSTKAAPVFGTIPLGGLPTVAAADNGKSLVVENGVWGKGYQAARTPRVAMASTDTTPTLDPNKLYVFPEMASLTITLAAITDNTIVNEYHFIFTSGATATTLTLPASVLQPDGFSVDANMVYEVSILENNMTAMSWEVTS